MNEILYATESYNRTPKDAANEFARNYFQEPRKVRWAKDGKTFTLVGGNRTYLVHYQNVAAPNTYQIRLAV